MHFIPEDEISRDGGFRSNPSHSSLPLPLTLANTDFEVTLLIRLRFLNVLPPSPVPRRKGPLFALESVLLWYSLQLGARGGLKLPQLVRPEA